MSTYFGFSKIAFDSKLKYEQFKRRSYTYIKQELDLRCGWGCGHLDMLIPQQVQGWFRAVDCSFIAWSGKTEWKPNQRWNDFASAVSMIPADCLIPIGAKASAVDVISECCLYMCWMSGIAYRCKTFSIHMLTISEAAKYFAKYISENEICHMSLSYVR